VLLHKAKGVRLSLNHTFRGLLRSRNLGRLR
jgi:hypothetical protein